VLLLCILGTWGKSFSFFVQLGQGTQETSALWISKGPSGNTRSAKIVFSVENLDVFCFIVDM